MKPSTVEGATENKAPQGQPIVRKGSINSNWEALRSEMDSGAKLDFSGAAPKEDPPEEREPPPATEPDPEEKEGEAESEGAEIKLEPAAEKALEEKTRAEKQWRERRDRERAELDRDRKTLEDQRAAFVKEWEPKAQRLEKLEAAIKRARYAPEELFEAAGLTADDYEATARRLYVLSKGGASDPKARAAADAAMRDRRGVTELDELRKEVAELRKERNEERQTQTRQAQVNEYLDGAAKAIAAGKYSDDNGDPVTVEAPLVKRMIEKSPAKARSALLDVAGYLADRTGRDPTWHEVATELERRRRSELEDLGVDVDSLVKPTTPTDEKKKPGTTLQRGNGSGTTARPKAKNRDEEWEGLRRDLETGNLES